MSVFTWTLKHYDRSGAGITAADYDGNVSNTIKYATNRHAEFVLDGVDLLTFRIYLDDPMAAMFKKKSSFVKLWRDINDVPNSTTYSSPSGTPDFAGVVQGIQRVGSENAMDITVQGILWKVQTHFHILNHHLVLDSSTPPPNDTGGNLDDLPWDQSALMWKLIDLVNGAFGANSYTGIKKPSSGPPFWTKTFEVAPFFVGKGSWTWSNFMYLLQLPSAPDIIMEYIHANGSPDLAYFKTAPTRGTDRTSTVHFDYHTGGFNLNEASEQGQVVPQQEGNYVWVTPQGGPNIYAGQSQDTGDMATNGIYMYQEQQSTPLSPASRFDDLAAARLPITENADAPVYACTLTPTKPPYYKANFEIGDAIGLNIDKSTWKVGTTSALGRPLKQRIYQVNLDMSDLNMETATPLISSDYASRVVPAGG